MKQISTLTKYYFKGHTVHYNQNDFFGHLRNQITNLISRNRFIHKRYWTVPDFCIRVKVLFNIQFQHCSPMVPRVGCTNDQTLP